MLSVTPVSGSSVFSLSDGAALDPDGALTHGPRGSERVVSGGALLFTSASGMLTPSVALNPTGAICVTSVCAPSVCGASFCVPSLALGPFLAHNP